MKNISDLRQRIQDALEEHPDISRSEGSEMADQLVDRVQAHVEEIEITPPPSISPSAFDRIFRLKS